MKNLFSSLSMLLLAVLLFSFEQPKEAPAGHTAFIKNWFNALNSSNWEEEVMPYLADPDGFIDTHRPFRAAFPDYHATVEDVVSEGDKVVAFIQVEASHQGDFPYGVFKGVEPSGKSAKWREVIASTIQDGKFAREWGYFLADEVARMQQFGIDCLPQK